MLKRFITAVVAIGAFIPLLFLLPEIWLTLVFCAFGAVGVWELLHQTGAVGNHAFLWFSCAEAFGVIFITRHIGFEPWKLVLAVMLYMFAAFACAVFDHEKITFSTLAKGFLSACVMPFMFASILRIWTTPDIGKLLVLMPWITVWVCDSAALFVGRALGKHKLAPYVSPKKTVEGSIGGLIGGVVAMAIYVIVVNKFFSGSLELVPALIFGFLGAIAGQLGDLSLSVIKREVKIKDYGKIFPGHGGVWDRFDSILFAAPLFEILYLHILPLIIK